MRFNNHNERMQHPQARLIPQSMWASWNSFKGALADELVPLMEEDDIDSLVGRLRGMQAEMMSDDAKQGAWLAIALSHPAFNPATLRQISDALAMSAPLLFQATAILGHLEFLEEQVRRAPNEAVLQAMIAADDYGAFRLAAENGHLAILQYLEGKAPGHLEAMVAAASYFAFRLAAGNGHLAILQYLEEKAPEHLEAMVAATSYCAFRLAAENGHLAILQYLEGKAPGHLEAMIAARNYGGFQSAAENGHLAILQYLEGKAPGHLEAMIAARNYGGFQSAAGNGHLAILQYLEGKAPRHLEAMIAVDNYCAFRWAAENGHLAILQYLEGKAPRHLEAMIAANHYFAFRMAARNRHRAVVHYLLPHATVFAYAEQHMREYGDDYIVPFVAEKLGALREQKTAMEEESPNAVFDIEGEKEAKLLFYVLRNLIRRNDPALRDDMMFLLEIPAVKALAHTEVTAQQPNELLCLALAMDNREAAELLLTIPAVRELSAQNDFYREERRGGLNLRALAQDRESSMTALSQGEQRRLKAAIDRYQPQITAMGGVPNVMLCLQETLKRRYHEKPATFVRDDGSEEGLPLSWGVFQEISESFSDAEKVRAQQAYYQHRDHTALRYLSKPNPLMHPSASYVYVDPEDVHSRWSTFEEYQPLIAMLFLAARDGEALPIDGYTVDSRIEHFIDELAHIGRAHNWDESRVVTNAEGMPILDEEGNPLTEEYDDLEGDRPSCFSGVKRRLFQAVRGHSLLTMLTPDQLKQEIREFVYAHFSACIQDHNRDTLRAAWDGYVADCSQKYLATLKELDIPLEKQAAFKEFLTQKYGAQYTEEAYFEEQITNAFRIKPSEAHAACLAYVGLESLLQPPALRGTPSNRGLFALGAPDSRASSPVPAPGPT